MFLHEHPSNATSWQLAEMKKMMRTEGVTLVEADQCMYGLKTRGGGSGKQVPAKKPTKFMTNSRTIGVELQRRCDKSHEHQALVDGRAKMAERYPEGLCRAICRGIVKLKMERAQGVRVVGEIPADLRSQHARVHGRRVDLDQFHEKRGDIPP